MYKVELLLLLNYYLTLAYHVLLAIVRQCNHVTFKAQRTPLSYQKYLSDQNFPFLLFSVYYCKVPVLALRKGSSYSNLYHYSVVQGKDN